MMRLTRPLSALLLGAILGATPLLADKKDDMLIAIQRDLAITQEQIRQSERATNERVVALEALLKQNVEAVTRLNQALAVIERAVNKQSDAIVPPLTRTAAKVDALSDQFGGLRDAVEESNSMLTRLTREVGDIKTQLTTMPPPGAYGASGGDPAAAGDSPALDESFFTSAISDYTRGNYEFAREQLVDFLRYSPNSSRAADAQYYLGAISYDQGNYDDAIRQFDMVLEKYPVGVITAEAQYKKALALYKLGRNDDAVIEFRAVLDRFPTSSVAPNAEAMIQEIGGSARLGKPSPSIR